MKNTSKDYKISAPIMIGSSDIQSGGIIIAEQQNLIKDILSLTLCITANDTEEDDIISEEEDVYDTENVSSGIDAYIAAQLLTDIKDKSKYIFTQRAIERSLEKSGTFDSNDLIMGQQAFVAGTLTISFFNALTKLKLINDSNYFLYTKTTADMAKAFIIGSGISWLGSKGRYSISTMEANAKSQNNQSMATGSEEESFAETPGKRAINGQGAAATDDAIDTANSLKDVDVSSNKDLNVKTGDTLMGEALSNRRLELLTFKDYFAFINNFFINDTSKVKDTSVILAKNLLQTNFQDYMDKTSNNIWEDKYGLNSLLGNNSKNKLDKASKKVLKTSKNKPKEIFNPLESKGYEYLALLTLIARDLTDLYVKQRYIAQKRAAEEEQLMAQQQEEQAQEQEQAAVTAEQEQMQLATESAAIDVEVKKKELKNKKKK